MNTCVYQKQHSDQFQGKTYKTKCGKPAVIIDSNGRELCQSHYNKFNAKQARAAIRKQLQLEGKSYFQFLLGLKPDSEYYSLFRHKLL